MLHGHARSVLDGLSPQVQSMPKISRALITLAGIMQDLLRNAQFSFHQMITSFVSPSYGLNANAHTFAMSVSMTTLPYALDVIQSRRPSAIANQAAVVFHKMASLIHVMKLVQFPGPPRASLKPIETRQFGSSIRCESQSLRKSKGRLQKTKSGRFSQPSTQAPPHTFPISVQSISIQVPSRINRVFS